MESSGLPNLHLLSYANAVLLISKFHFSDHQSQGLKHKHYDFNEVCSNFVTIQLLMQYSYYMISFNDTDLQIITIENDLEDSTNLYLLLHADARENLETEKLLDELSDLETSDKDEDQKDDDYEELLERMGIIEIFDQDEIENLTEEGLIDPEDLHYSIYQIVSEEMDQ